MDDEQPDNLPVPVPEAPKPKVAAAASRINKDERLLAMVKRLRRLLPGDDRFGDPLSTAGPGQAELIARRVTELADERPGVLHEAGLSALQVLQAISETQGRARGASDVAIAFTDLVGFSSWALEAGDAVALDLLRRTADAIEPAIREYRGEIVKRLGDGTMSVFSHPQDGLEALVEANEALAAVEAPGYRPQMRAGLHVGRPKRIGGDYLGVDVNVAARIAEHAGGGEVMLSDRALEVVDTTGLDVRRRRMFRAKGVPRDMVVYAVRRSA